MTNLPEDDPIIWHDADELDGPPPLEILKGRASRFKHAKAPHWVLLMTALPHNAFRLYCFLVAHANTERGDGRVWPTEQTLAELMGYSRRQSIIPLVKILEDTGLLEVQEYRYGTNKSRKRNVYTVHEEPPEGWEGIANLAEWYAARRAVADADTKAKAENGRKAEADGASRSSAPRSTGAAPTRGKPGRDVAGRGRRAGKRTPAGVRMTKAQAAAVRAVEAAWPAPVAEQLPTYRPPALRDAILAALDGRTAEQLAERVSRRWSDHRWAEKNDAGEIESYVAVAIALVRPSKDCPDASCEDGWMIDSGELCRACETRRQDFRRDRRQGVLPEQRDSAPPAERQECAGPRCSTVWAGEGEPPADWMCRSCRDQAKRDEVKATAAAERLRVKLAEEHKAFDQLRADDAALREREAAEEAHVRDAFKARGLWGDRLDWAVTRYMRDWEPGHAPDVDEVATAAAGEDLATA